MSGSLDSKKIVIAGGSGFLGISLAKYLTDRGASVVIVSRSEPRVAGPWTHAKWDGRTLGGWKDQLNRADALVNLAGRSVDCMKTPDNRDEILRSRVETTQVLGEALREIETPPSIWVQMSTSHIYGDPPTDRCDEDSALGYGLAPFVGKAWEKALRASALPAQRIVILRTSFVLGRDLGAGRGALNRLVPIVRLGLGGKVASGQQGISWIHETDMNRLFERGIIDESMSGVYIASAPNPVSQSEFMRELRSSLGVPMGLPVTEWMVRIGARYLLRTDPELVLYGRYVYSKRLETESFEFSFPTLQSALRELCS